MILTESQSLQLATILIEATDEKGPGFVAKVKDVIKRAAKWIKEKAIFLATKIKESFTKVVKLVLQPATKLLANSKFFQEYARSFKEKDIDADHVPELKKYFEVFDRANNAIFAISSEMHKLTGGVGEDQLEEFRGHLDKALNMYAKAMNEYEEKSSQMEDVYRSFMQVNAESSRHALNILSDRVSYLYGGSSKLAKELDVRVKFLEKAAASVSETNSRLEYQYQSKLAWFLGKISAGWVGAYVKFFAFILNLAKRIASPILNFYKKRFKKED